MRLCDAGLLDQLVCHNIVNYEGNFEVCVGTAALFAFDTFYDNEQQFADSYLNFFKLAVDLRPANWLAPVCHLILPKLAAILRCSDDDEMSLLRKRSALFLIQSVAKQFGIHSRYWERDLHIMARLIMQDVVAAVVEQVSLPSSRDAAARRGGTNMCKWALETLYLLLNSNDISEFFILKGLGDSMIAAGVLDGIARTMATHWAPAHFETKHRRHEAAKLLRPLLTSKCGRTFWPTKLQILVRP